MNEHSQQQLQSFFTAIEPWRGAYTGARLNYLGVRQGKQLVLLAARIYLMFIAAHPPKHRYQSGSIEAGQWDLPGGQKSVEQATASLLSPDGLNIENGDQLLLAVTDYEQGLSVSAPMLLHPEGLSDGNRLAVLSITGTDRYRYCLLYTSPSPRDRTRSRMPSSA